MSSTVGTYWTPSASHDINKLQFGIGETEVVEVDLEEDFDILDENPMT